VLKYFSTHFILKEYLEIMNKPELIKTTQKSVRTQIPLDKESPKYLSSNLKQLRGTSNTLLTSGLSDNRQH
jgi:hypothetical protein